MKKIILVALAVTGFAGSLKAQDRVVTEDRVVAVVDIRDRFMMGVKAGFNHSNVFNKSGDAFAADGKFGFVGGAFLGIPIITILGFQPEVLFSQKGFHGTGKILGSTYELTRTLNYIDVPLMIAFKPSPYITFLLGPQYSYLLKQKDVFTNGTTSILQEKEFMNDNLRKNTLSFAGGVDINGRNIVLGIRGGIDAQDNNSNGSSTTPNYNNVWYQGTLGFRFFH